MDENEITQDEVTQPEITDRLRALGRAEIPDPARSEHLRRMASTPTETSRGFGRAWVAAAAIVGFLAGSTGLAAAGALPDSAQDVAHDVLSVVQIDVPEGKRGPCVSAIAKGDLPEAEKKAAKAACPKGGSGGAGGDVDGDGSPGRSGTSPGAAKHAGDPCKGKPPWAGKNQLTEEQREAMKAERATACGRDLDDAGENEAEDEAEELEETEAPETQRRDAVTTTTVAQTTTTAPTTTEAPTTTAAADETTTTEG